MNIDRVEKNKYVFIIEIILVIGVILFVYFVFTNNDIKVKEEPKDEIEINFLSAIGNQMIENIDYIEVYTCLENYDSYFEKCKIGSTTKIDNVSEISKIIDKLDNVNQLDIIEELPSTVQTYDYRGKPMIDLYYKNKSTAQLIFLDNYLIYIISDSNGILQTYYNYGNNSVSNYIKTIK